MQFKINCMTAWLFGVFWGYHGGSVLNPNFAAYLIIGTYNLTCQFMEQKLT